MKKVACVSLITLNNFLTLKISIKHGTAYPSKVTVKTDICHHGMLEKKLEE